MGIQDYINENTKFKTSKIYLPRFKDLDSRPLPQWYESSKVGIFVHWGVYSVPSFKSEWFWYLWKTGMLP